MTSDAVAAAAWRAWWTDDAIHQRLLAEIEFNNRFTAWRIRMLSADLSEGEDWGEVAGSIARSRVTRNIRDDGYQPLQRTPNPWPPDSLEKSSWREGAV